MTGDEAEQVSRSQTLKDLADHAENSRLRPRDAEPLKNYEQRSDIIRFTFE